MDSYCDISLNAPTQIELQQAAGRVVHIIHALFKTHGEHSGKVGLAFPQWQPNIVEKEKIVERGSIGHVIRVLGPSEAVEAITDDRGLLGYLGDGWNGRMGQLKPLPEAISHVRFTRDRRMERTSKAYRRREAHRRTEAYDGRSNRIRSKGDVDKVETLYILLPSLSTGQYFPLNIRREVVDRPESGDFNSYGLSSTATVPDF